MEKSRSFSAEYSYSYYTFGLEDQPNKSYSFNGPSSRKEGNFGLSGDPELKRKKRIASYNVYTVQGKVKSSLRGSFKWIKSKLTEIRYGL